MTCMAGVLPASLPQIGRSDRSRASACRNRVDGRRYARWAVRAAVGDADNYFVFAVAAAVLARGSHVLDIRRGHCPGPCVNL